MRKRARFSPRRGDLVAPAHRFLVNVMHKIYVSVERSDSPRTRDLVHACLYGTGARVINGTCGDSFGRLACRYTNIQKRASFLSPQLVDMYLTDCWVLIFVRSAVSLEYFAWQLYLRISTARRALCSVYYLLFSRARTSRTGTKYFSGLLCYYHFAVWRSNCICNIQD